MKLKHNKNRKAFTLVELILASAIGAFILLVAAATLRTNSTAAEAVNQNTLLADEVRFAANLIRTDLANLYRDKNPLTVRFVGTIEETDLGVASNISFRAAVPAKARPNQPEADIYEIQYFLKTDNQKSCLVRRICPNVTIKDQALTSEETTITAAGILMPVSENIITFQIMYFDGTNWLYEWSDQEQSLPKLVEITLIAAHPDADPQSDPSQSTLSRTITVTFPRITQMTQQQLTEMNQAENQ